MVLIEQVYEYGFWDAVLASVAFFGLFALAFLRPRGRAEWRSMGVWTAFFVALFTEMFGFPLTIYLLTSLLGDRYPTLFPFAHAEGHLWVTLLGGGRGTLWAFHLLSNGLILVGLVGLGAGWWQIHRGRGRLVTTGIYRGVRHPQYTALFLIVIGFLIQWPTLPTLAMAPVLLWAYARLARQEERLLSAEFAEVYTAYASRTPAFVPGRVRREPDPQLAALSGSVSPAIPPGPRT